MLYQSIPFDMQIVKDRYLIILQEMIKENIIIKDFVGVYDETELYVNHFKCRVFKNEMEYGVLKDSDKDLSNCSFLGPGMYEFNDWVTNLAKKVEKDDYTDISPLYFLGQFSKIVKDLHLIQKKEGLIFRGLPTNEKEKKYYARAEGILYHVEDYTIDEYIFEHEKVVQDIKNRYDISEFQNLNILFQEYLNKTN